MTEPRPAADRMTGGLFSALILAFAASVFITCCSVYKLARMAGAHARFAGGWLRRRAWWGALPVLVLLAGPVAAQEAPPAEERDTYPVVAAAWCTVHDGDRSEEDVGCDLGPGLPLYRYGKLSWVAVLGQETVGTGIAWVPHRPERGPIPAVAIGVVAPYDSSGIDGSDLQLAFGATLAFTGRGE